MTASRHHCTLGVSPRCTRGNGKPKRRRCTACGGSLFVETGVWGVFVWTSANHYPASDALSTHGTEAAARRAAERDDRLVWRFIRSTLSVAE